jgi:hypothetical protein
MILNSTPDRCRNIALTQATVTELNCECNGLFTAVTSLAHGHFASEPVIVGDVPCSP